MKNYLPPLLDKVLLPKRFIIETLFEVLKFSMGLEHTRQRSPVNALVHILSCLAAYTLAQPGSTLSTAAPSPSLNLSWAGVIPASGSGATEAAQEVLDPVVVVIDHLEMQGPLHSLWPRR